MEPFPKRQRLYAPIRSGFPHGFGSEHEYYEAPESELEDYEDEEDDDEEEEEEEGEEGESIPDPNAEFEQRRALLDYKLKSTFEAIFEKYGKDFDGIGDEIDLATGEIIVNNGHLVEMQDERDTGDGHRPQHDLEEDILDSEEGLSNSAIDDDIMDEEDYGEEQDDLEDALSEDDMMEDDIILRGFAQASQFLQPEINSPPMHVPPLFQEDLRQPSMRSHIHNPNLPSQSEIIAQFGSQLGPQIIKYVAQQQQDDSNVEPAWRIPDIPTVAPRKRLLLNPVIIHPDVSRSPSPGAGPSLWAPTRRRRRKTMGTTTKVRLSGDSNSLTYNQTYASAPVIPPLDRSIPVSGDRAQIPTPRRKRTTFTAEDDELLLTYVEDARQRGVPLSQNFWKGLEAKYPHHPWKSWCFRYNTKSSYLESSRAEDSDVSDPEFPSRVGQGSKGGKSRPSLVESSGLKPPVTTDHQRPNRIRRPAQRDSRIISWSDAANTIKSLDPDLHAGILDDIKRNKVDEGSWAFNRPISSAEQHSQNRRVSENILELRKDKHSRHDNPSRRRFSELTYAIGQNGTQNLGTNGQTGRDREEVLTTKAPCPHADCRHYPTKMYRLQRMADEEQSHMSLHLLQVHHTTPFPCGELGCAYKGENGFFMQRELVNHVRTAHPTVGALYRLRGRVDSDLINMSNEFGKPLDLGTSTDDSPISRHQDSDFISPRRTRDSRITSSSRPFSSSSGHDRTLTPRGMTGTSTYTPMTSVSSLIVHHSSSKPGQGTGTRNSQIPFTAITRSSEENLTTGNMSDPNAPTRQGSEQNSNQGIESNRGPSPELGISRNAKDEADQVSSGLSHSREQQRYGSGNAANPFESLYGGPANPQATQSASSPSRHSLPASIPDSQISVQDRPSSPSQATKIWSNTSEQAPSDLSAKSPGKIGVSDVAEMTDLSSMLPPRRTLPVNQLPFNTPLNKRKPSKPVLSGPSNAEEIDELSLLSDGFVMLSSRQRTTKTPFNLPMRIKREETADVPSNASVAPPRKRKLETFQMTDEIDELMADEFAISLPHSGRLSERDSKIKTEDTEPVAAPPLFNHRRLPRYKKPKAKKTYGRSRTIADNSCLPNGSSTSQKRDPGFVRTGTPLLDLTPSRTRDERANGLGEIADSGTETSSPLAAASSQIVKPRAENHKRSSQLDGLLTPTRKKPSSGKQGKEGGPAIVVKTPGGTLRKCGEGGFACRKSFCFRCSSQAEMSVS
ncbi:hypothetical protein G7Y89_g12903 [Cudoniella acicularis]|uniref:TERF2-interacting telomeric protein 1 Myb domain-containing protein n=1 Tax=Cudoniella acicularis TaxID=354080 RepID=A0A8H4RAN0_9HELO|nr:hypothetical protein G7Y89_g12903 [Cudoniella acicularis]